MPTAQVSDQPIPGHIHPAAYTGDIVGQLEHWRSRHLVHTGELIEAAREEIIRLRKILAELGHHER